MADFADFQPAGKADAASPAPATGAKRKPSRRSAAGAARVASAPPPAAAAPAFLDEAGRRYRVVLAHPLTFGIRVYAEIVLRRPTSAESDVFFDSLEARRAAGDTAKLRFPIFFDAEGEPVPPAVLDALDPDDDETVFELAPHFLPRRMARLLDT